jgi:hypothetical protein
MRLILAVVLLLLVPAQGAISEAKEIGPESDWCEAVRTLPPGEELVLRPGEYSGACGIRRGGSPNAPLVIRALDLQRRPRIVYPQGDTNVINIYADHVVIQGLEIGPTLPNVDGVRIYTGNDITVEDCRFVEMGGISVVANHRSVNNITVRRNEILRSKSTTMYFGCHEGNCTVSNLLVERNYIHGVQAPDPQIGYGLEVKLNSFATIRDNVIVDTKGPGIMVYGAHNIVRASSVERNFVAGSRTSSAIVVGGGPVVVRNNIAIGSAEGGIGLENYGRRGLLRSVVVSHNTVYGNTDGGILVPPSGQLSAIIVNNAAHTRPGTTPYPKGRAGVVSSGNVDCTWRVCFVNPIERDFSPLAIEAASPMGTLTPKDDYFGLSRGQSLIPGAIEHRAGPIPLGVKPGVP